MGAKRLPLSESIPERWRHQPPSLPETGLLPNPWLILCLEVCGTYWNVLAYEHDGLEAKAEVARKESAVAAAFLRRQFDKHPQLGTVAADATIAWEVHYARKDFAEALQRERTWKDFRAGRAPRPIPKFLGEPRNWRLDRGQPRRYL